MKIFSILKKDLLILLRERADMLVLFLMPLAFIIPISLALGAGDGYGIQRNTGMMTLTVADYDRGPGAQTLLTAAGESLRIEKDLSEDLIAQLDLGDDPACALYDPEKPVDNPECMEKAGQAMLHRSWRTALLIIPPDFSKAIEAGSPIDVTLLYDPAGDSASVQQIEGVLKGATIKLSLEKQVMGGMDLLTQMSVFAPDNVRASLEEQISTPAPKDQQPALSLVKVSPKNFQARLFPDTYQQTIPGYTVMFVFFIITSMTVSIRSERLNGTFRRLLSAPVSKAELLGGKLLATIVIGLVQVFILFAVGALVFGLQLGNDPLAFFLLTAALVTAAATLGLAFSTTRMGGGMLAAPLVIAALLGGCMFPLDLMPAFLRAASLVVPHSWALNGYQNLMVRGQGLQEVFPQIAALIGFALLFFLIAIRRFDFERGGAE